MYGRISIRGWDIIFAGWRWLYEPQLGVKQAASGVGVPTPCGAVSTRGTIFFVLGWLELKIYGRISDLGTEPYPPRAVLALRISGWGLAMSQWSWGFHTVRGGIDPGIAGFVSG